ncbi:MAG: OmpA family protein [Formivibrio sp.]|nr:OmpA family protein [Formivibrio sp.]
MTYTFSKKQMVLAVSCALALGVLSNVAQADTSPADTLYAADQAGSAVRSGTGLCWHTGTGPAVYKAECDPAPVVAAVEPAPVKMAEAAAPAPAPVAPVPVIEKVKLDADTLFTFDKAVLRPEGKSALNDFADKYKDIKPEMIMVVGYTDRLGSDAYNQRLSEQRASAVKSYLIAKNIDPSRINSEGKGEKDPVTKDGECKGGKSAKVIACLQPDRRVEVDVTSTQTVK